MDEIVCGGDRVAAAGSNLDSAVGEDARVAGVGVGVVVAINDAGGRWLDEEKIACADAILWECRLRSEDWPR